MTESEASLPVPLEVLYCAVEYCKHTPSKGRCALWLNDHHPMIYEQLYGEVTQVTQAMAETTVNEAGEGEEKQHQTRGGKALPRDLSAKEQKEMEKRAKAKVIIRVDARNKRKDITTIRGLEAFGLDLKKVAKRMANRFACGASVVKNPNGWEEINIQGDVADDLFEFIPAEYDCIREEQLEMAD